MKYIIFAFVLTFCTSNVFSQKNKKKTTTNNINKNNNSSMDSIAAKNIEIKYLSSIFQKINASNDEVEINEQILLLENYKLKPSPEWVIAYKIAQSYIKLSDLSEKNELKTKYENKATGYILSNSNDEFLVLDAYAKYKKITPNNKSNSQIIENGLAILEKAKTLNPENPRVYYLIALYNNLLIKDDASKADLTKINIVEAIQKYKNADYNNPLIPNWGVEEANNLLNNIGR